MVPLFLVIVLDQYTKMLARDHLRSLPFWGGREIISGFLQLRYSENMGVAFGMLQRLPGGRLILLVEGLVCMAVAYYASRFVDRRDTLSLAGLGVLTGAALGNLIDRFVFGQIADFVVVHVGPYEFPAFNLSDVLLTAGALTLYWGRGRWMRRSWRPSGQGSRTILDVSPIAWALRSVVRTERFVLAFTAYWLFRLAATFLETLANTTSMSACLIVAILCPLVGFLVLLGLKQLLNLARGLSLHPWALWAGALLGLALQLKSADNRSVGDAIAGLVTFAAMVAGGISSARLRSWRLSGAAVTRRNLARAPRLPARLPPRRMWLPYLRQAMALMFLFPLWVLLPASPVLDNLLYRNALRRRRVTAAPAALLQERDQRPPVLFLRSFSDDERQVKAEEIRFELEEAITAQLWHRGPVIAIGRPGESLAPAGAARQYVGSEEWQGRVLQLIRESSMIVVLLGTTGGVKWELNQVFTLGHAEKLVAVVPPFSDRGGDSWTAFWQSLSISDAPEWQIPEGTRAIAFPAGRPLALMGSASMYPQVYEAALDVSAAGIADSSAEARQS